MEKLCVDDLSTYPTYVSFRGERGGIAFERFDPSYMSLQWNLTRLGD